MVKVLFVPGTGIGDLILSKPFVDSLNQNWKDLVITTPYSHVPQSNQLLQILNMKNVNLHEVLEKTPEIPGNDSRLVKYYKQLAIHKETLDKVYASETFDYIFLPYRYIQYDSEKTKFNLNIKSQHFINNHDLSAYLKSQGKKPVHKHHRSDQHLLFLEYLGLPSEKNLPVNLKILHEKARNQTGKIIEPDSKYFVVNLGVSNKPKSWSSLNFKKVSEWITKRGYKVILVGSSEEYSQAKLISAENQSIINTINQQDYSLDFTNNARIMKRATATITCDTGLMHLADAVGGRVISLFSITNHEVWGPYHNKENIITNYDNPGIIRDIFDFTPITQISPTKVISKIEEIIS